MIFGKDTPIYDYFLRAAEAIAPSLAIELVPSPVETAADIERAIESFARAPNGDHVRPPFFSRAFSRRPGSCSSWVPALRLPPRLRAQTDITARASASHTALRTAAATGSRHGDHSARVTAGNGERSSRACSVIILLFLLNV
jgi:hypothetical protein